MDQGDEHDDNTRQLPSEPSTPESFVTAALASWFDLPPALFVDAVGGEWRVLDSPLPTTGITPRAKWFSAGQPLQVVLGVSAKTLIVACPQEVAGGLAGPGRLNLVDPVTINITHDDPMADLASAVANAVERTRSSWDFCMGCRNYLPVSPLTGYQSRYCSGCAARYMGFIAC